MSALEYFQAATALKTKLGDEYGIAVTAYEWAKALVVQSALDAAITRLENALALVRRHPNQVLEAKLRELLYYCYVSTGHTAQAIQLGNDDPSHDSQFVSRELPRLLFLRGIYARDQGYTGDCVASWGEAIRVAILVTPTSAASETVNLILRYVSTSVSSQEGREIIANLIRQVESNEVSTIVAERLSAWIESIEND